MMLSDAGNLTTFNSDQFGSTELEDAISMVVNSELPTSALSSSTAWKMMASQSSYDEKRINLDSSLSPFHSNVSKDVYTSMGDVTDLLSVTTPLYNLFSYTSDSVESSHNDEAFSLDRYRPNFTVGQIKLDVYYEVDNVTSFVLKRGIDDVTGLMLFCEWYQVIHGYMAIAVCSFGIVANLMNIVVLTRKAMVSTHALSTISVCFASRS